LLRLTRVQFLIERAGLQMPDQRIHLQGFDWNVPSCYLGVVMIPERQDFSDDLPVTQFSNVRSTTALDNKRTELID